MILFCLGIRPTNCKPYSTEQSQDLLQNKTMAQIIVNEITAGLEPEDAMIAIREEFLTKKGYEPESDIIAVVWADNFGLIDGDEASRICEKYRDEFGS